MHEGHDHDEPAVGAKENDPATSATSPAGHAETLSAGGEESPPAMTLREKQLDRKWEALETRKAARKAEIETATHQHQHEGTEAQ